MSHMHDLDITLDQISKIEGHAEIEVNVRKGEVKNVHLKVAENKRFYTQAIRNKHYSQVPQLVSRICGTCSVAHLNCSTIALENALNFQVSEQTQLLRELSMYGLNIRDHAMHAYFFSLPDVLGKDSVMELLDNHKEVVHQAFHVKGVGNALSKLVLGRAIHGLYSQVGYYTNVPKKEEIQTLVKELKENRPAVLKLIDIFSKSDFLFERNTDFVAVIGDKYDFLTGEIHSSAGLCVSPQWYFEHLNHRVIPYSQASGYELEGEDYMVGALARLNMNQKQLNAETKKECSEYLKVFPSKNIFHNNLAQGIEILHCIDNALEVLESTDFKPESKPVLQPKAADGIGLIEAPRGNLYYLVSINSDGKLRYGNIITPSSQNQINMENDLKKLIPPLLDQPKQKIIFEMEKLIRAYDPCFSCASHFLIVKWTGDKPKN
ncbi:nickel-dependent hydrogenase large subunit [Candidatus Micrarchaeota archaeon]|nr:nickel-dependent hydrogenase large subunit [Candidatus Micrarchaeota archaeon]MBU1930651.1 nickel-dependent hydrogenase large subunit [Candidatus Micrarchaeota archaeon]